MDLGTSGTSWDLDLLQNRRFAKKKICENLGYFPRGLLKKIQTSLRFHFGIKFHFGVR